MKANLVLFNLETNMYLSAIKPFTTSKDWKEAMTFDNEQFALSELSNISSVAKENKLNNWCTRTFYQI